MTLNSIYEVEVSGLVMLGVDIVQVSLCNYPSLETFLVSTMTHL